MDGKYNRHLVFDISSDQDYRTVSYNDGYCSRAYTDIRHTDKHDTITFDFFSNNKIIYDSSFFLNNLVFSYELFFSASKATAVMPGPSAAN